MASYGKIFVVAVIIIAVFAVLYALHEESSAPGMPVVSLTSGSGSKISIEVEIASTEQQRQTGLMFRETLGKNKGMLFIFPDDSVRTFWMKNTLIPLDMIFIDSSFTVVKISHAVPCTADSCVIYSSGMPARYVLEVNANMTDDKGIGVGSRVEIKT
jgi:uncharacterized protein